MADLSKIIEHAFDGGDLNADVLEAVHQTIQGLNDGTLKVVEKRDDLWHVNSWLKKAILLYFKSQECVVQGVGFDKIPLKFSNWEEADFKKAKIRALPGSIIRNGSYVGPNCVLMPSFINIGAHVGEGTMIDTWATVGSCAYVGKNCHISGGTGIGGVLEPVQGRPVIIEDNCFIGARSEIAEGVIVGEGSVISMGVYLGASTKIIDRSSGEIFQGRVPAYSVVVPGSYASSGGVNLYCGVIVKKVDAQTRSKTAINDLLRDF